MVSRTSFGELSVYTAGVKSPGSSCIFWPPSHGFEALFKEGILERDR